MDGQMWSDFSTCCQCHPTKSTPHTVSRWTMDYGTTCVAWHQCACRAMTANQKGREFTCRSRCSPLIKERLEIKVFGPCQCFNQADWLKRHSYQSTLAWMCTICNHPNPVWSKCLDTNIRKYCREFKCKTITSFVQPTKFCWTWHVYYKLSGSIIKLR